MERSGIYTGIAAVLLAVVVSGCAHRGPILVDISYLVRAGVTPEETPKAIVGIAPFRDERGKKDSVAGKLFKSVSDDINDLVVQGTISQQVTNSFKTALSVRDITVKDIPSPAVSGVADGKGTDLVLTGEIKSFWIDAVYSFPRTRMAAKVELRIIAEDPDRKKIIHAVNVSSSIEDSSAGFSAEQTQKTLSEALTAAINQIFDDEVLKKRLK